MLLYIMYNYITILCAQFVDNMSKYNGISVDDDFELDFINHYQYLNKQLEFLYQRGKLNQKQFRSLQLEYLKNSYKDFFIQRVECETDLIEIV